ATGTPQPKVTWRREDGSSIILRTDNSRVIGQCCFIYGLSNFRLQMLKKSLLPHSRAYTTVRSQFDWWR
ncbi:hypothetical protein TSAR_012571, partial [Trichomalopsis sarcophagae]